MIEANDGVRGAYIDAIPFARNLGFEVVRFEGGESELRWTPRPEHFNNLHMAHGGACMTLLDIAMAAAARSESPELGVMTIEMKTTFMRPSLGTLSARGRLMHRTRSMAFVEATIHDAEGLACAHSTGTFKFVQRRVEAAATSGTAVPSPGGGASEAGSASAGPAGDR